MTLKLLRLEVCTEYVCVCARAHAQAGDLRPYLHGFFDTTVGTKQQASSYKQIALTLGVDSPSQLLFATDVLGEAQAARAAGWKAVLVVRPGNAELPADHGFPVITSMTELLSHYASA